MSRRFTGDALVIATHNEGKCQEFRDLFGTSVPFKLVSAGALNLSPPKETGSTFLENARIKALFVARTSQRPALADDSGLCVAALEGAPGIYTADWAESTLPGKDRDFYAAMKKVYDLTALDLEKKAHFTACLVIAWPDGHTESAEGYMHGHLTWPPRGENGHGYDPFFRTDGYTVTCGEMNPTLKNSLSHRAAAFHLLKEKCF